MPIGKYRHRPQACQAMAAQAFEFGLIGDRGQVQLARYHHVAQGIRIADLQVQRRIGIALAKTRDRVADDRAAVGMDTADAQARLGRAADGADLAAQGFQAHVQAADFLVQQRGLGGALHALAHAFEQAQFNRGFERGQGGADGGRRHIQAPGRGGDALRFIDGAESLDLFEREGHGRARRGFRCVADPSAPGAWPGAGPPGSRPAARADRGAAPAR